MNPASGPHVYQTRFGSSSCQANSSSPYGRRATLVETDASFDASSAYDRTVTPGSRTDSISASDAETVENVAAGFFGSMDVPIFHRDYGEPGVPSCELRERSVFLREFVNGMEKPIFNKDHGQCELSERSMHRGEFLDGMDLHSLPILNRSDGEPQIPSWELQERSRCLGAGLDRLAVFGARTCEMALVELDKMPLPGEETAIYYGASNAMDAVVPRASTELDCARARSSTPSPLAQGLTSSSGGFEKMTKKPAGLVPRLAADRYYSPPPSLQIVVPDGPGFADVAHSTASWGRQNTA